MPLYEYQCEACEHRFEVIQKYSDAPIGTCGKCGGPVRKLLSSPAIQFKGSGWYITDYARAGKSEGGTAKNSTASSSEGASSESKAEGKSESKSESKSDGKSESKSENKSDSKPAPPSTS